MNETVNQIPKNTAEPMESTQTVETTHDPDDWSDLENFDNLEVMDGDEEGTDEQPAEPEADQPKEEADTTETPATQEPETADGQETADQPELIELKHLGQVVRVTPEQLNAYAQMGLDYQRIRDDRDAARQEVSRLTELETFLKELAAPMGLGLEDFMDQTRAQVMADREKIDRNVALQRVKLDREKKAFEAEKKQANATQKAQEEAEAKRQGQFLQFAKEYPQVKPNDIPKEVWDKFREGMDLVSAYAQYEARALRGQVESLTQKLEAEKRNQENKKRSTGSQKSAGNASEMDAFDRLWYDGT